MQTSNQVNSTWVQRGVIIMIVGVLLVAAAYVWGNRLSASPEPSPSLASQFDSFRNVAAARAVDAAQLRDAAAVASAYAGFRGVAAARAADAAAVSTAGSSAASEFASFQGVAAVRAADAAQDAAGPESGLKRPRWAGLSVPRADGPGARGPKLLAGLTIPPADGSAIRRPGRTAI